MQRGWMDLMDQMTGILGRWFGSDGICCHEIQNTLQNHQETVWMTSVH